MSTIMQNMVEIGATVWKCTKKTGGPTLSFIDRLIIVVRIS